MDRVIQSIPLAISVILLAVLILMVITNIITEVLKKVLCGKVPVNILAVAISMIVTLLAFLAVLQIMNIAVTWYLVAGAVGLGFFVAFASMFGYDKLKQTLGQITLITGKQE